ncbi:SGNH/GDSL hydrolase family protein [Acidipila rosea]|uniref:Lysophospholipase L1-like esterase n=1 Tax=Acidipila rosea TaxID=768535 RepID=A0A4R1LFC6_9BACT|nr:SGNH/GDSL hydrolase family protein [Acidipila rosea]TCK75379.1 lysophospholipase L1-like esterase [Acidipila rosea]
MNRNTARKVSLMTAVLTLAALPGLAEGPSPGWTGSWAASPMGFTVKPDHDAANTTYRDIVHLTAGGDGIRIQLTNEFGTSPLTVGASHVAISAADGATQPGTDHALTFHGQTSVMIPAGAMVLSDPVPLKVDAFANLAVSVYLPTQPIAVTTCHSFADATSFTAPGDDTAAATMTGEQPDYSWCFVKGVDVKATKKSAAIVAFGDSITDGAHSTRDANQRWPDLLAQRLHANKKTAELGVLNQGIGGNRLLHDNAGPNALARFDRDVLAQSGVKYLILLEGINDIGRTAKPIDPGDEITTEQLEFAMEQMVERAHQHGIKVFGATLTPYVGAGYQSPAGEQMRQAFNQWIRTSGTFDGVIDFDKATQDPAKPDVFLPADDSGDHLHPNDAGYKAMANSIDLSLFK